MAKPFVWALNALDSEQSPELLCPRSGGETAQAPPPTRASSSSMTGNQMCKHMASLSLHVQKDTIWQQSTRFFRRMGPYQKRPPSHLRSFRLYWPKSSDGMRSKKAYVRSKMADHHHSSLCAANCKSLRATLRSTRFRGNWGARHLVPRRIPRRRTSLPPAIRDQQSDAPWPTR